MALYDVVEVIPKEDGSGFEERPYLGTVTLDVGLEGATHTLEVDDIVQAEAVGKNGDDYLFRSLSNVGHITHIVYCKTDAGPGSTIDCYLGAAVIEVHCRITQSGTNLNAAVPRLKNGDPILVQKINSYWRCFDTFNPSKECICE